MKLLDYAQLVFFLVVLLTLSPMLGSFMVNLFSDKQSWIRRFEDKVFSLMGVVREPAGSWRVYARDLILFHVVGFLFLFLLLMFQNYLFLNPDKMSGLSWHLALNTAVSFITNTNWQAYGGESTMSHLSQMVGLGVQNFLSAAVGISVAVAITRAIAAKGTGNVGHFWSDLFRSTIFLLLPLSIILSLLLVGQGVVQRFGSSLDILTVEGLKQLVPVGPAASQVAIKMLGTNGGGFFNVNSAHPLENPTALSNFLQMLSIFLIPAALVFYFGRVTRSFRHGLVILGVMLFLFISLTSASLVSEFSTTMPASGLTSMEGKEVRFGSFNSILFSSITTAASCGAVNAMHSSLSPLSGGIALLNMLLGEIVFGGVGAGLYGMLLFVFLTVFIAGLMIGRTPEYLGKKIGIGEVKMVILATILPSAFILFGVALVLSTPEGLAGLSHKGPHGFTEVLYALTSAAVNNGSAFAGLSANTPFYNVLLAVAMLVGRFAVMIPVIAIAGSISTKSPAAVNTSGTLPLDGFTFGGMLCAVIIIVGALTFLPVLFLGPIVEHLLMLKAVVF